MLCPVILKFCSTANKKISMRINDKWYILDFFIVMLVCIKISASWTLTTLWGYWQEILIKVTNNHLHNCQWLGWCNLKAYCSSRTYHYCRVLLSVFANAPASSSTKENDNISWITHPSFCMTMQGHMQQELWLSFWIAWGRKCFTTLLILQISAHATTILSLKWKHHFEGSASAQ